MFVAASQPSTQEILQRFWSLEEAPNRLQTLSPVERLVEDFTVNHKHDHDGCFVLRLPFKFDVTFSWRIATSSIEAISLS